jgi:hypothetical protein
MDYAKNFKIKDIVLRAAAFVLYFSASGFMGKLCVLLVEPLFSLVLSRHSEFKSVILYVISVIVMFAAVCFFSLREGYNDTESLRFSYKKAVLSCIAAGIAFCYAVVIFFAYLTPLARYLFMPHFLPAEIDGILSSYIFFPGVPVLSGLAENIKHLLASRFLNLCFSVSLCVILSIIYYKKGRNKWIETKKKKIENLKR